MSIIVYALICLTLIYETEDLCQQGCLRMLLVKFRTWLNKVS